MEEKPVYQKIVTYISYLLLGVLSCGALLDSIGNSISFPPVLSCIIFITIFLCWIIIEISLKKESRKWIKSGNTINISKLGIMPRLAIVGALTLLALPQFIDLSNKNQTVEIQPNIKEVKEAKETKEAKNTEEENIQIVSNFIRPVPKNFFLTDDEFYENVELNCNVKNYGKTDLLITAMEIEIIGSNKVDLKNYKIGINILGPNPEKHNPVRISPGETVTIGYEKNIYLPGITTFLLESFQKEKSLLLSYGRYKIINIVNGVTAKEVIKLLNNQLEQLYGKTFSVRIKLFSEYKKVLIKTFLVNFNNGQTIFEQTGQFQHDIFLGECISQLDTK